MKLLVVGSGGREQAIAKKLLESTDVEHEQKIQIQEANYNGHRYIDNFRGWFDPTNPIWGTVTYIYPD